MKTDHTAFWLDDDYDHDQASDGISRYNRYLRDRAASIAEIANFYDDVTVPFAVRAWEIANGPIMAPGLVRRHGRVDGVTLTRSEWDGELIANVSLVVPAPSVLRNATDPDGRWYKDRRRNSWANNNFEGVTGEDLAQPGGYLVTTSEVIWRLGAANLPTGGWQAGDPLMVLYSRSWDCVTEIVRQLDRQITPLVEQLEKS